MAQIRNLTQDDILSLIHCAETYGHTNNVCLYSLWDWASPVTEEDIERYARDLSNEEGYGEEDYENAVEILTGYKNHFENPQEDE